MELYHSLPNTHQTLARFVLKELSAKVTKCSRQRDLSQIELRVDVLKLAICSLLDVVFHSGTAIAKCTVGVMQLPLYPVWDGIIPEVAFSEAGAHLSLAIQSILAVVIVPIPALVSPDFAITSYRWLSLGQAPNNGLSTKIANRIARVINTLIKHQQALRVLCVSAIAVAAAIGYYPYYYPAEDSKGSRLTIGMILLALVGVATITHICCSRGPRVENNEPSHPQTPNEHPKGTARTQSEPVLVRKRSVSEGVEGKRLDFNSN